MGLGLFSSFIVLLLSILSNVGADHMEVDDYSCSDMGQDIYLGLHNYMALSISDEQAMDPTRDEVQEFKDMALHYTGVDIDHVREVKKFACNLIEATSLDDVHYLINAIQFMLRRFLQIYYPLATGKNRENGGLDTIDRAWQVYKRFLIAADDANYPAWPLNVTPQETLVFIYGMVNDFGDQFLPLLILGFHEGNIEDNTDRVDINRFVWAVEEATTFDEFVDISGLSSSTVNAMQTLLNMFIEEDDPGHLSAVLEMGDAAVRVMWMMDRNGLLDLQ